MITPSEYSRINNNKSTQNRVTQIIIAIIILGLFVLYIFEQINTLKTLILILNEQDRRLIKLIESYNITQIKV